MKERLLSLLYILLLSTGAYAQPAGKINGIILAGNGKPFPNATVQLTVNDSVFRSMATLPDGSFQFNELDYNTYRVVVSAIGYKTDTSRPVILSAGQPMAKMDAVTLQKASKELAEVSVTAKKNFIENKIDRTVVNVGALISNTGANALEVLQQAPGVNVDASDNIIFKGKGGVLVLIDDKPTYLSASDLATYLRSLPAAAIDKIELMDNPPAKYEAAGSSGVINIKTKKARTQGLNGSLSASVGQSVYSQTNENLTLNYFRKKLNFFFNGGYGYNRSYRKLDITRNYFNDSGHALSGIAQTSYFRPKTNSANIRTGFDYYISPKTVVGIVLAGTWSKVKDFSPVYSNMFNASAVPDSSIVANNATDRNFKNGAINLNYNHQFDSLGTSLAVDLDYIKYRSDQSQAFLNSFYNAHGQWSRSQDITANLPSDIDIYAGKLDYVHSLKGKGRWEAGVKGSYVNIDNASNYFNMINGNNVIDYNMTNRFLYKENINAGYLNLNKSFKRFEFQTGLRLENTNVKGHQLGNALRPDSSFSYSYTNLFPTAYLSYKITPNGNHSLVGSFGKRISRPYYQDLNPFIFLQDVITYSSGNPYLRPQFEYNYKLTYNYKGGKVSVSLLYNNIKDIQNEIVRQNGNTFIESTGNIGKATFFGGSVVCYLQFTKWWFFNAYGELLNNTYKGQLYDSYLDWSALSSLIQFNNQFSFSKVWSAELSGFYAGRRVTGQFVNDPMGQVNAGIQKKILQGKGTVKLSVRDVFYTYVSKGSIKYVPNTTGTYRNIYSSQLINFGFTYSFGKITDERRKRSTGNAAETEQNRVRN